MAIESSSSNKFDIETINGKTRMFLDSDKIKECLDSFRSKDIECLVISPARGYRLRDLAFLEQHSYISNIVIVFPPSGEFDISAIAALAGLQSLTVSAEIDFSLNKFPKLEIFRGYWRPNLGLLGCSKLKILSLNGFNPKTKDLTGFPELESLSELSLIRSNIASTRGVCRLKNLTKIELSYVPKIEVLEELDKLHNLEAVYCENCKQLRHSESLSWLKQLKSLKLIRCGKINSIAFLRTLPGLEEFRFVGTEVADGDLSPLLNLKWVGFDNKRHYSHTDVDLDMILRKKGGGAVARLGDWSANHV